jgi:hypothetical protein
VNPVLWVLARWPMTAPLALAFAAGAAMAEAVVP